MSAPAPARTTLPQRLRRRSRVAASGVLLALLAACGGGGGGGSPEAPVSCSVADQKAWLRGYFDSWYFWYGLSPKPSPASYPTVAGLFDALLYTGTNASFPADRWSYTESTESFNQFFGDGQTLGYGVSVAGLEVAAAPSQPLYVRYVEPLSPAALAGVVRGDRVVSLNGRAASELIAADDFSVLTPSATGQQLTAVLANTAGERTVTLTAAVYSLTPVSRSAVVTLPSGRKMGYLVLKDMVSQSLTPMDTAFADFKAQGVSELVLDLRYNGGGLVSVATAVSSYIGGAPVAGRTFTSLLYNDQHVGSNSTQTFSQPARAAALGLSRVYVLMGRRTCSASELVINGLRGVGVDVVAIGETSCGKPVGFLPESQCGTTYSVVNFESVNARNEGRYFDGFDPTCPVGEDWSKPLGAVDEPLLAAARQHADTGACPVASSRERPQGVRASARPEPGERSMMIGR